MYLICYRSSSWIGNICLHPVVSIFKYIDMGIVQAYLEFIELETVIIFSGGIILFSGESISSCKATHQI